MKTHRSWIFLSLAALLVLGSFDTVSAQSNALTANPSALTFNAAVGQTPPSQTITVGATKDTASYQAILIGAGCGLVSLSGSAGTVSATQTATITVSVNTFGTVAGQYYCTVLVNASGLTTVSVPVTINIGSGGGSSSTLSVNTTSVSLGSAVSSTPVTSSLTLTNSNTATTVSYTASASSTPAGWLSVSPTTGTVSNTSTLQVQANPTGLAAGTYQGTITITPQGASAITVQVTFTISGTVTLQVQQGGQAVSAINFYYQIGTSLPAQQSISVSSSNSGTPLAFNLDSSSLSSFLVVTPSGNLATPQTITLAPASTLPSLVGLQTSFSGNLQFSSAGASNTPLTIPVRLTAVTTPVLTLLSSLPSTFNYASGGSSPATQSVQIGSSSSSLGLIVTSTLSSGQNWLITNLSSNSASATSPSTLTIGVNPAGLAAGNYTATITVTSQFVPNALTIPVSLNVSTANVLSATPSQLTFTYQTGGTLPVAQTVTITSSSAATAFTIAPSSTTCGSNWLTISQGSGNTGSSGATVSVSINPNGISAPQACNGTLNITTPGSATTIQIPVVLQVSANAILQANPSAVTINGQIGNGLTTAVPLTLASSDGATTLTYTVSSTATWLYITPTAGSTPVNVQLSANTSDPSLKIGANTTILTLTSPSLQSPITIPVTLNLVSPANLLVSPNSLVFTIPVNAGSASTQNINLSLSGSGLTGAQYSAVASTNAGNWLSVSPTGGAVPGTIGVSANVSGLAQGTYLGTVVVTVPGVGQSPYSIGVTLNVTAPQNLTVAPTSLNFATQVGGTAPASQTLQVGASTGSLSVSVGTTITSCPGFFSVTPNGGSTPLTLTVTVSNTGLAAGSCAGTITVSANGVNPLTIPVTMTVTGAPDPLLATIANGASFVLGAVAPGEIVSMFGANLGPTTLAGYILNPNGTFATKVSDTEVLFDGVAAPILFVRNDQLAVVVPYQVTGRSTTSVQVRRLGQTSTPITQRVVDAAPGIFTAPSGGTGQGAIVNQNGVVNSSTTPAPRGTVVSIYLTGAGQTSPQGVTGSVYSTNPLSFISAPVSVTLGGQNVNVQYKGGAPFNIQGLYQINVEVPASLPSGQLPVSVTVGGVPSQSGVYMYVQ